ncbi:MAG: hypothetical protein IJB52_14095 [Clostridia bacterium]|nr:hypothetical protein [Clostridia bacterium]
MAMKKISSASTSNGLDFFDNLMIPDINDKNSFYDLATKKNLPAGTYTSKIVDITRNPSYDEAFNIFYDMSNASGEEWNIRMTYFSGNTITKQLLRKFAQYGIAGHITNVIDIVEEIVVEHKKDNEYVVMDNRKLLSEETEDEMPVVKTSKKTLSKKTFKSEEDEEDDTEEERPVVKKSKQTIPVKHEEDEEDEQEDWFADDDEEEEYDPEDLFADEEEDD